MNRKAKYGGQGLSRPPNGQEIAVDDTVEAPEGVSLEHALRSTPKDGGLRHEK